MEKIAELPRRPSLALVAGRMFGYICAFGRGPSVEEQMDVVLGAGVPERAIRCDTLTPIRSEQRRMFGELTRILRGGDVLVVPMLSIFGCSRNEVVISLAALEPLNIRLVSIEDGIDTRKADPQLLFKLGKALLAADVFWKRHRTLRATRAARYSGNSGRRSKLSAKREAWARALYMDPESTLTNYQLAEKIGLSPSRMHAIFGARPSRNRPPPLPKPVKVKAPKVRLGPAPALEGKRLLAVKRAVVDTDLTMSEIAGVFGVSLSTLTKSIPGGRAKLRARVKRGTEKLKP